jgi:hypothetical protein
VLDPVDAVTTRWLTTQPARARMLNHLRPPFCCVLGCGDAYGNVVPLRLDQPTQKAHNLAA